jgi:molybdopterin synthase catalytic subunit
VVIITEAPISPESIVSQAKTDESGCVVTYVGLIRESSRGKPVTSVEYRDPLGRAEKGLQEIAASAQQSWPISNIIICHRTGKLKVGDINLVVAVASAHRKEGFAACQYIIDQFKEKPPTHKVETYQDGSTFTQGAKVTTSGASPHTEPAPLATPEPDYRAED